MYPDGKGRGATHSSQSWLGFHKSSAKMSKAAFEAHGTLGMERWLAAQGGNALQHLWKLRADLRARPHTNETSEHFRRTYAVRYTPGKSIGRLSCLRPCTHVFGANAGS
jgi:hypothetical protein